VQDGQGPMEMIALEKSCGAQYTLPRVHKMLRRSLQLLPRPLLSICQNRGNQGKLDTMVRFAQLVGLSEDGLEVRLRPLPALVHLRLPKSESTAHHEVMSAATLLASRRTVASVNGTAVHVSVLLPCSLSAHADWFGVHLLSGKNESTLVGWDSKLERVVIDRSHTSAAGLGASDPMTGKLKGGCPLGRQLNLTAVVDGGILEVYVNDRFAITAALWPSEDIATEERQLGLIAVPKTTTPPGLSALAEESVVFSAWKLQTKGVLTPEAPYGSGTHRMKAS
jgi:hypothetical protein